MQHIHFILSQFVELFGENGGVEFPTFHYTVMANVGKESV
jgi:hypothetical protein